MDKNKIKSYLQSIGKQKLNLKNKLIVQSISELGKGTGNLNYLVRINNKKFIFRFNMNLKDKKKASKEYNSLKLIEDLDFGPKVLFLDDSRKFFDTDLVILEYEEGVLLCKTREYSKDIMFRKLGKLCAEMHSIPLNSQLKKLDYSETYYQYKDGLNFIRKGYLHFLNKNLRNKELLNILFETFLAQKRSIRKEKYICDTVFSQGDFCEQNILVEKGNYKLIVFEDI